MAQIWQSLTAPWRALPERQRKILTWAFSILLLLTFPLVITVRCKKRDEAGEIVVPTGEMVHHRATVAVIHGSADPSLDAAVVKAVREGVDDFYARGI